MHSLADFILVIVLACLQLAEGKEWTVIANGKTCMLMTIEDATIRNPVFNVETTIPDYAIISSPTNLGSCPNAEVYFELTWRQHGYEWSIGFQFKRKENNDQIYSLDRVKTRCMEASGKNWTTSYKEYSFQSVKIGKSMICKNFVTGTTRMGKYLWQPYAQAAGNDYGPSVGCEFGIPVVSKVFIAVFVLLCIFVMIVVFAEVQDR